VSKNQRTLVEIWPIVKDDLEKFISDRPGWLIGVLRSACNRKGNRGWKDVETVINILQFLKDTEYEY
jgi:hypothetical protein